MKKLLLASSVFWSGCAAFRHPPDLTVSDVELIRQHAATAQGEISATESGGFVSKKDSQGNGATLEARETPERLIAQTFQLVKRHDGIAAELAGKRLTESDNRPYEWVSFPLYRWITQGSGLTCAANGAERGGYQAAAKKVRLTDPKDTANAENGCDHSHRVFAYFVYCVYGVTCFPVYDLVFLPFTFPYDAVSSIGSHLGHASRAHRIRILEEQLAKIEATPEYLHYLAAEQRVSVGAHQEVDPNSPNKAILSALLDEFKIPETGSRKSVLHSDVDNPQVPQQPEHPNDFALVIGVEKYKDKNLPPAEFAERDADAIARYLQTLGIPKDHVILLKGDDATDSHIRGYLDSWLPKNVQDDSSVFFYFSGHGSPDPVSRKTYLMPWDGEPKMLHETALQIDALYKSLGNLKSRQILVAMDSCFSGSGGRSVIESGARPLITVDSGIVPPNVTVISAAHPDEIAQSMEKQGHGMLTYFMLKGLNEGNGNVHDLCQFLKPQVSRAAALENQEQHPVCRGPAFKFW